MSTGIHLDKYHAAVQKWLKLQAPWLKSVEFYPEEDNDSLDTPCAFAAVMGWNTCDHQPGNGQLTVVLEVEVLVVTSIKSPSYQLDARNAAMAVSLLLQDATFDLAVSPAKVTSAEPDAFEPNLDQHAVWSVKYRQKVSIGKSTLAEEEVRGGIRLAVNPVDDADPYEYHPLELPDA